MRKLAVSNRTQVAIAYGRLAQPVSTVAPGVRKAMAAPAEVLPGDLLACDVITLVPPQGPKLASEADERSKVGDLTNGRFSRTR
jgi:hypothetical protein